MIPKSIDPLYGSMAADNVALLINSSAKMTSFLVTFLESLILALASANLIILSSYLGVAVIIFLEDPIYLMFKYP